jgi:WD repeat-containing protein 48
MDDNILWTVTGDSSIKRWKVPPRRAVRATTAAAAAAAAANQNHVHDLLLSRTQSNDTKSSPTRDNTPVPVPAGGAALAPPSHGRPRPSSIAGSVSSDTWSPSAARRDPDEELGIPLQSLVRLTSHNHYPFIPPTAKGRDAEVATLYSTASLHSVPKTNRVRSALQSVLLPRSHAGSPLREEGLNASRLGIEDAGTGMSGTAANTARAEYEMRELATDAQPLRELHDDVIEGESGLVRSVILNDRIHALTVDTSGEVAVWDLVRSKCLGKYLPEDVAAAEQRANRTTTASVAGGSIDDGSSNNSVGERSPKGALDAVRERIEGQAVVLPWSSVDTKTGVLTVHITERCFEAEIYADELSFNFERPVVDDARSEQLFNSFGN